MRRVALITIRLPGSTRAATARPSTKRSPSSAKRAWKPKRWKPSRRAAPVYWPRRQCAAAATQSLPAAATALSMKSCRAWPEVRWRWAWCRWAPPCAGREPGPANLSRQGGSQLLTALPVRLPVGKIFIRTRPAKPARDLHRSRRRGHGRFLFLPARPRSQAALRLLPLCRRGLPRLGHPHLPPL